MISDFRFWISELFPARLWDLSLKLWLRMSFWPGSLLLRWKNFFFSGKSRPDRLPEDENVGLPEVIGLELWITQGSWIKTKKSLTKSHGDMEFHGENNWHIWCVMADIDFREMYWTVLGYIFSQKTFWPGLSLLRWRDFFYGKNHTQNLYRDIGGELFNMTPDVIFDF